MLAAGSPTLQGQKARVTVSSHHSWRTNHVMATIGTFSRTDNGFAGSVKTLNLNVKSVKFIPAEDETENGPDFRVFAGTIDYAESVIMRSACR